MQAWGVTYGVPGLVDKTAAAAAALNVALTREAGDGMRDGLKGTDGGNYKWSVADFFAVVALWCWSSTLQPDARCRYFTSPSSFFSFDTAAAYNGVIQARFVGLYALLPPPSA